MIQWADGGTDERMNARHLQAHCNPLLTRSLYQTIIYSIASWIILFWNSYLLRLPVPERRESLRCLAWTHAFRRLKFISLAWSSSPSPSFASSCASSFCSSALPLSKKIDRIIWQQLCALLRLLQWQYLEYWQVARIAKQFSRTIDKTNLAGTERNAPATTERSWV